MLPKASIESFCDTLRLGTRPFLLPVHPAMRIGVRGCASGTDGREKARAAQAEAEKAQPPSQPAPSEPSPRKQMANEARAEADAAAATTDASTADMSEHVRTYVRTVIY